MTTASPSRLHGSTETGPLGSPRVQDDDIVWTEYLKQASDADSRLMKDWTKVIDVLLVFVALFSGILTSFIIQISSNFQPDQAQVTNQILVLIYNRTMNATIPIDFDQLLRLDDTSMETNVFQNWLLYTSLAISIIVAAVAMAAKLWIVRYTREVTTSGPPRVRAKRRQEVFDGLHAWKLEKCIDALPILSLIAVMLFALFIHSAISVQQTGIAYLVGSVLLAGISFIVVASFSAAFLLDSPYRSPFSDFVNFIFRIFPHKPIPKFISNKRAVRWRTIGVFLVCMLVLAAGGYYVMQQNYAYLPLVFYPIAGVFALMRKGRETDMPPRLVDLPLWVLISSIVIFATFVISAYFSNHSTILCIFFFVVSSVLLCLQGLVGIKMSETRPTTVEAEAISWLLKTSSDKDPAWFKKAAQIAGQSPNARALLVERLLPLLLPLIISLPKDDPLQNVTPEQETYINTLATLMDFEPLRRSFLSNMGSLNRPVLPGRLVGRLETLKATGVTCTHGKGGTDNQERWNAGVDRIRCPQTCVGDAVEHILRLHESGLNEEVQRETASAESKLAEKNC